MAGILFASDDGRLDIDQKDDFFLVHADRSADGATQGWYGGILTVTF
jgi:hypothetical protein